MDYCNWAADLPGWTIIYLIITIAYMIVFPIGWLIYEGIWE